MARETSRARRSLRKSEICLARACDVDTLGLRLHTFMPGYDVVLAIGNIVDLVISAGIAFSKVRRGANDDVPGHLRMYIAEQRHHARGVELKGAFLAFRPRTHVMAILLVPADRRPEDIVLDRIIVLEINRRPFLHHQNGGAKAQALLVHENRLAWGRETLAGNGVNIDDGLPRRDLAFDGARERGVGKSCKKNG